MNIEGMTKITLSALSGPGATTNPVLVVDISNDGVNWAPLLPALSVTMPPSSFQTTAVVDVCAKLASIRVLTAGVAAAHVHAELRVNN
jgi:hypothetical protein